MNTLKACKPCWRDRSGVEPTNIGGLTYRPVASLPVGTLFRCHFCGRRQANGFRYERTDEAMLAKYATEASRVLP